VTHTRQEANELERLVRGPSPAGIQEVRALQRELFFAALGSRGSDQFRTYVQNGIDILQGGRLSCAKHVTSIVRAVSSALCREEHATVDGALVDLRKCGWYCVNSDEAFPKPGCILLWERGPTGHEHLGFYLGRVSFLKGGDDLALSNDGEVAFTPVLHQWLEYPDVEKPRNTKMILWHRVLEV